MAGQAPMGRLPPRSTSQGRAKANRVQLGQTVVHVYGAEEIEEISSGPGGSDANMGDEWETRSQAEPMGTCRLLALGCRLKSPTGEHLPTEGKSNAPSTSLAGAGSCLASP
eukprot:13237710-Heterocapsa_arctica.AAC.1